MTVEFTSLQRNYALYQEEYEAAVLRALRSGWYILGPELEAFEQAFAKYLGVRHCIGMNSGTDALILAVRALGIGGANRDEGGSETDEVIVPAQTYIASVLGVTENGARPVYVDVDPMTGLLDARRVEEAITPRTRAILPVHLYGQACDMAQIRAIADRHGLAVLEDCAQSHGARWAGRLTGTWGTLAAYSFYPTKPLGALGDAGAVVTDDDALADRLRMLRNYGSRVKYHNESLGRNSRLDEVQAAILSVGLSHLEETNERRTKIARRYLDQIRHPGVTLPTTAAGATHVYHLFPVFVQDQAGFQGYLEEKGIKTQVHYPIPPYAAECYAPQGHGWDAYPNAARAARQEVSLPIYSAMPDGDVDQVIEAVNRY